MALTTQPQPTPDASPRPARRPGVFWSRLHFLIRFVGLTGFLVACVGLVLAGLHHMLTSWEGAWDTARTALGRREAAVSVWLILGGAAAVLVALAVEIFAVLRLAAGRRSAMGVSAVAQIVLATALLVGVNWWSFRHAGRIDLTRGQDFTLPADVRTDLAKLKDDTTIVVYLRHKSADTPAAPEDSAEGAADRQAEKVKRLAGRLREAGTEHAAERKVIEKVKDLAEQLRELGLGIHVEVLDVESPNVVDTLERLTRRAPGLRDAIQNARENTIFFHTPEREQPKGPERVQQIAFNDFYRLNRTRSQGEDNLVLRSAGVRPVTNRILNLEARRPRVGILVFHPALSTEGSLDMYSLAGARKALAAEGFDVRDIIIRRLSTETRRFEPAVDNFEDSNLDRLRRDLAMRQAELEDQEQEIKDLDALIKALPKGSLEELNKQIFDYARSFNPSFVFTRASERNRDTLVRIFTDQRAAAEEKLKRGREDRDKVAADLDRLDLDAIGERRRLTDLHAKLKRALADCDLLFIPRLTILPIGMPVAPPEWHDLDPRQAEAVKDFLRSGKPVLACFGPVNMPRQGVAPAPPKPPDPVEEMLAELGVHFGKRTVLYYAETRAFSQNEDDALRSAREPLRLPALRLQRPDEGGLEGLTRTGFAAVKEPAAVLGAAAAGPLAALPFVQPPMPDRPNPVRESLRLTDLDLGHGLQLRPRFLRPVYLDPLVARRLPYHAELLSTSPDAWNDEEPFSTTARPVPRFVAPSPDDPDNNTPEARRRGSFTVGVAFETAVPRSWMPDTITTPPTVRVAALGHGGLFSGRELSLANERLLLDTCNWLLGRDDRLAQDAAEWRYPRVHMSEQTRAIWDWAMWLGLPVLSAYVGLVVLLARRVR